MKISSFNLGNAIPDEDDNALSSSLTSISSVSIPQNSVPTLFTFGKAFIMRVSRDGSVLKVGKTSHKHPLILTFFKLVNDMVIQLLGNRLVPLYHFIFNFSKLGGGCMASITCSSFLSCPLW
ncbi:hypothetical protein CFOL_v3_29112 [Cephalotus follicularis]|uniref:Uncharacterized protein n=1 Tax=Cephalotus follicularis TaxID=3775 RepID=A0A1Q3D029_CEPFO|nr:hypothetical protein CFOL_v3_29112 [Cephalotus follicularis]